jgi:hypothetical protein
MPFHADRIASVLLMLSLLCVCGHPSIISVTQAVFLWRPLMEGYPPLAMNLPSFVQPFSVLVAISAARLRYNLLSLGSPLLCFKAFLRDHSVAVRTGSS